VALQAFRSGSGKTGNIRVATTTRRSPASLTMLTSEPRFLDGGTRSWRYGSGLVLWQRSAFFFSLTRADPRRGRLEEIESAPLGASILRGGARPHQESGTTRAVSGRSWPWLRGAVAGGAREAAGQAREPGRDRSERARCERRVRAGTAASSARARGRRAHEAAPRGEARGDLERLPRFPEIRVPEHAPTVLSFELQARVLEEIPLERRGAFLAAARLGLRPGEIRALNVDDYQDGKLLITRAVQGPNANAPVRHTKNRRSAWMPVYDDELRTWIEWRVRFTTAEERLRGRVALFPNPSGRAQDRRWLSNSMREEWNRAAAKIGVRCRMYEGTKHTFATNLLEAGVSQEVIQAVLRHRDRRSTERYAKLSLAAAVRLLPRHNSDGICGPLVARDSNANLSHKMSQEIQGLMESKWRGGRDSNPQLPA